MYVYVDVSKATNLSGVFLSTIAELEYVALTELGVVVEVNLGIADHHYGFNTYSYIHAIIDSGMHNICTRIPFPSGVSARGFTS